MKKIFVLFMTLIMVCGLAVPAFAETDTAEYVTVNIVDFDGSWKTHTIEATDNMTVKSILRDIPTVQFSTSKGTITSVNGKSAKDINSPFDGSWVAAANGKIVNLETSIAANDILTIYWNEPALSTRLVQVMRVGHDVFRFFYFDGSQEVEITNIEVSMTCDGQPMIDALTQSNTYITDERGQIWIDPNYIDDPEHIIKIVRVNEIEVELISEKNDKYTNTEREYFNSRRDKSLIVCDVEGQEYRTDFSTVTPATGDTTLVLAITGLGVLFILMMALMIKKKKVDE